MSEIDFAIYYYENQYRKKIELDGGLFEVVMIRK